MVALNFTQGTDEILGVIDYIDKCQKNGGYCVPEPLDGDGEKLMEAIEEVDDGVAQVVELANAYLDRLARGEGDRRSGKTRKVSVEYFSKNGQDDNVEPFDSEVIDEYETDRENADASTSDGTNICSNNEEACLLDTE